MTKRIAIYAGVALLTTALVSAAVMVSHAQQVSRGLSVVVTDSRITLTAQNAPLADVLRTIAREAGIKVVLQGDVNGSVTESVVNAPLDELVRRLTRGHSAVLVYDQAPNRPDAVVLTEVRVTGAASGRVSVASDGARETTPQSTTYGSLSGATADAPRHALSQLGQLALTTASRQSIADSATKLVQTLTKTGAPDVNGLRTTATTDPDPNVRLGAIQVLASLQNRESVEAVRAAIRDADPVFRSQALAVLRRLHKPR